MPEGISTPEKIWIITEEASETSTTSGSRSSSDTGGLLGHDNYLGAPKDGSAWLKSDGDNRFRSPLRGGSWGFEPARCRSANRRSDDMERNGTKSYMGFRVVCGVARIH